MKWLLRLTVLLTVACVALAGCAIYYLGWKTNTNCEATLTFAQTMQAAVINGPDATPESVARANEFFNDVYSKLHC